MTEDLQEIAIALMGKERDKISGHFTLQELVRFHASWGQIPNHPFDLATKDRPDVYLNLVSLVHFVLQPLRDRLQKPVEVLSGYRSARLNRRMNGAQKSQHLIGQAADIFVPGEHTKDVLSLILKSDLPYDQAFVENTSWIHLSWAPNPRGTTVDHIGNATPWFRVNRFQHD